LRVTLEKYAETKALLRHFGGARHGAVLAAVHIGEGEWREAEAHWRAAIDGELGRGVSAGAEAFDDVFQRARTSLAARPPELEALVRLGFGFAEAPPASPLPAPPPPAALAEPPRVAYAPSRSLDSTLPAMPALKVDDAVPFAGRRAPPPSVLEELPPVSPGDLDRTDPLGARVLIEDVPFQAAPELTLEQFASLEAELRTAPESGEQVFARYGLADAAERSAALATWGARLAQDPELQRRAEALVTHYLEWLQQQSGPRSE
jgi:hypothetical protein